MAPSRFPDDDLLPFRTRCDPLADDTVAELFDGGTVGDANRLMRELVAQDGVPGADLPGPLRRYLDATSALPAFADRERLRAGEEVFAVHGPLCVVALFHASLPTCYAARDGVQVLAMTARLSTDPTRRIAETAQFVLDVMAPGGMAEGGSGLRDAQKVRLMHAAVRHLLRRSGHWRAEWMEPGNQLDMAMTLQTFGCVVLDALRRLGVTLSPAEEDAYVHAWRVVGGVLGLDERLLPDDAASARALMATAGRLLFGACAEGHEMEGALQGMLEHVLPGNAFDGLVPVLTRQLAGDEVADLLGVKPADWTRHLFGPLRVLGRAGDDVVRRSQLARRIAESMSLPLLEAIAWMARGGQRAPFAIPTELAARWGVRRGPAIA